MKTSTDFHTDTSMALLLIGESGSGKTNLAFEFPDPYVIDWGDANLSSAVQRHPSKQFLWDVVDKDDAGKPVPPDQRWERGEKLLATACQSPQVQTIVDDCLSLMQVALCDHVISKGSAAQNVITIGGIKVMNQSLWEPFKSKLRSRIITAKASGKRYVMTCHVKVDKDEVTGTLVYTPLLSGKLNLPSLFTDYWQTTYDPSADKKVYPTGVRYFVRTVPNHRFPLKCSCGLPPDFEFTWEAFTKYQQERGGK